MLPPVTFRAARTSDAGTFDIKRRGINQTRPDVATINGEIILAMHGETVLYQNGTPAVAHLIRARKFAHKALVVGYIDADVQQRKHDEKMRQFWADLRREPA